MTQLRTIVTDDDGARALSGLIAGTRAEESAGSTSRNRSSGNAIICAGPEEFPGQDPEGTVNSRTIYRIDGASWADETQAVPIRRISNGRQIAWPVGRHGLCVQDVGFWAVNIGALTAATNFMTAHVVGNAALLDKNAAGQLVITDGRVKFINRDTGMTLADGTPIILGYVSGDLTILWASCDAEPDLEDIPLVPEA